MQYATSTHVLLSTSSLGGHGTAALYFPANIRLAFLNAQAALEALPRVIDIMGQELNWSRARKQQEWQSTVAYLRTMGLPEKLSKLSRSQVERGEVAKFDNTEEYRRYTRHDGPPAFQN